ncbi:AEC family transporter [Siculibacillus lacustris]|uniref:AEC family transporter n=1 Tax=Siculibacillus lacustris TaxID=1549641 RepID=A0A4V2KTF7_9HYPH|nr:AEC family transporter [Siculibacillus lacustris]TBW37048.1 AEC family transporter [Siculibacillus lacustris]
MLSILAITFPIFLLILVGWGATISGITSAANIRGIGVFVIRLALPAMLFRALSQRPILALLDWNYLGVYVAGSLFAFGFVFLSARVFAKRDVADAAMMGLGSSSSNSGFIGFPIAVMVVGPDALVALSLTLIVENLVMIPIGLGLAESGRRAGEPIHRILLFVLRRLTRNPMILGILAGCAASATGWLPPAPLQRAIDLLADASTAAALFAIGGALASLRLSTVGWDIGGIVSGKLLLHPLAVGLALLVLPAPAIAHQQAMLIFAASPMLSVYALLSQTYGHEKRAAAALLGATSLSFLTLTLLVGWLHAPF